MLTTETASSDFSNSACFARLCKIPPHEKQQDTSSVTYLLAHDRLMASSVIHPFCTHVERHPIMLALYETIYHYNLHHLKLQCVQWYGRHSVSHSRTLSRRNIWTSLVCMKRFSISFLPNTQPSIRYEGVPQSVEIAANGRRLKIEVLKGALELSHAACCLSNGCVWAAGGHVLLRLLFMLLWLGI